MSCPTSIALLTSPPPHPPITTTAATPPTSSPFPAKAHLTVTGSKPHTKLATAPHHLVQIPRRNSHLLLPDLHCTVRLHELRAVAWKRSLPAAKRAVRLVAESASVAGSGGDLSDKWLGPAREKKRRSVAGIDQEELVDPVTLADPDSLFCDFNGVHIHHKVCDGREHSDQSIQIAGSTQLLESEKLKIVYPMILLHGFGASVFSWGQVMKPLAQLIGSKVLAFDRPAFGLTLRNKYLGQMSSGKAGTACLNPYSMAFSMLATLSFIDLLGSDKAILMGHSAGCLVAANAYFEAPERIAAMILVAPAIFAPLARGNPSNDKKKGKDKQSEGSGVPGTPEDPIAEILKGFLRPITGFAKLLVKITLLMRDMVQDIFKKILSAILRSSVSRMLVRVLVDKFGIQFIKNSWCDANKVTTHTIQGYTKPLKAKDWENALLEYTICMLMDSQSESKPPLTRRLSEISCPVLIISGDTDRLVPAWNAKRLAAAIPGSTFEAIKNCGHLPHEEKVEEFLLVVNKFLRRVFASQDKV